MRPASPTHDRVQTEVSRQRTPSPLMMQMGTAALSTQPNGQLSRPVGTIPTTEFTVGRSELASQPVEAGGTARLEAMVRTVCSIGLVSMVESVEYNDSDSPSVSHRRASGSIAGVQVCLEPIAHTAHCATRVRSASGSMLWHWNGMVNSRLPDVLPRQKWNCRSWHQWRI